VRRSCSNWGRTEALAFCAERCGRPWTLWLGGGGERASRRMAFGVRNKSANVRNSTTTNKLRCGFWVLGVFRGRLSCVACFFRRRGAKLGSGLLPLRQMAVRAQASGGVTSPCANLCVCVCVCVVVCPCTKRPCPGVVVDQAPTSRRLPLRSLRAGWVALLSTFRGHLGLASFFLFAAAEGFAVPSASLASEFEIGISPAPAPRSNGYQGWHSQARKRVCLWHKRRYIGAQEPLLLSFYVSVQYAPFDSIIQVQPPPFAPFCAGAIDWIDPPPPPPPPKKQAGVHHR
jgi:hypothetical protein